jgi:hypothetical protein
MDNTLTGMRNDLAAIEKARKKVKIKHELVGDEGRDLRDGEALTLAHAEAEAEHAAMAEAARDDARKSIPGLEAAEGPGTFTEPDGIAAEDFRRPYLDQGHGAESAQAQGPNVSPLQHAQPGMLRPLEHVAWDAIPTVAGHGGPIVDTLRQHQGRAGLPVNMAGEDL